MGKCCTTWNVSAPLNPHSATPGQKERTQKGAQRARARSPPKHPQALLASGGGAQAVIHSASPLPHHTVCVLQARFTHGMFTVYPGFGSIPAGGVQTVTVDCVADPVGKCEELIAIDISDRDPRDHPAGVPYSLLAEACLPGTEC